MTHGRIGSCSSHRIWARVPSPPAPAALQARDPLADAHCTRHFSNLLQVVKQAFSAASPCMRMYIYQRDSLSRPPALPRSWHRWNHLESWSSRRSPLALPRSAPPGYRRVPEVEARAASARLLWQLPPPCSCLPLTPCPWAQATVWPLPLWEECRHEDPPFHGLTLWPPSGLSLQPLLPH